MERQHRVLATPNLKGGAIDVIDMKTWKLVNTIPNARPGLLHAQPREHAASRGPTR